MDHSTRPRAPQELVLIDLCSRCDAPGGVYSGTELGEAVYECPRCTINSVLYEAAELRLSTLVEVALRAWLSIWERADLRRALPELLDGAVSLALERLQE